MEQTGILGSAPPKGVNRRRFLRGMAATAGLGLGAGILAACGDNTATTAPAATLAPTTLAATTAATTAAATSAAPTTAATTVAATTSAPTTAASTTVAATTAAPTTTAATANAATTAAANSAAAAAPAGYTEVGRITAVSAAPVAFSAGDTKGYIFAKSATEVYTFSNICTHMGCEVPAYKTGQKMFMCPCHGSEYTETGEVIKGPAKARLPLFDNKVIGDIIYAKLS